MWVKRLFTNRFSGQKSVTTQTPIANNYDEFLKQASGFLKERKYSDAAEYYTKALKYLPQSISLHYARGISYLAEANNVFDLEQKKLLTKKAVDDFSFVVANNPDHADACRYIAFSYFNLDADLYAVTYFIKAAKLYFHHLKYEKAIDCFERALYIKEDSIDALNGVVMVYKNLKNREGTVEALVRLGQVYIDCGKYEAASKIEALIKQSFPDVVSSKIGIDRKKMLDEIVLTDDDIDIDVDGDEDLGMG
ncbi:hypothetical protein A2526_04295 [candidate division WOR-1 bacterium RIFOXYD2_FULL_36_8]|uniref:Outer membrane lipoprotein BamD-like domain-containing protein n=1 Tax=candidate division WOR-1 bacterium RIFOXYB2_FULL_36_35 TaxID=1802578 RepID=A0A1F4S7M8_UNCSA|nr:MAG: hypothetical protein A2230_05935 [candidate division WOR-1 bacterium RIFOXYA2_FULL_36_21]OGC16023.1 MAG: hypothetical protein A2282_05205 [candidate division WOR-1 bacterium RIFOXYA12_FULL_36_13]OGC16420.1 MAG: hypothetical protein A2290_02210 [candidate division WOR-1 bacterium RIFOXYB2_FULL_36_35]OGC38769.1 MAG: hypothetical protein A2526_04295 [candidate division WOR-1 bacterium RIFOXYD2_FULL_36_8]